LVRVVRETEEEAGLTDAGIANQLIIVLLFGTANFKREEGKRTSFRQFLRLKRLEKREISRADLIKEKLFSL
jgi:hypothetical protein